MSADNLARHVVMDFSGKPTVMRCLHCGETAVLRLPMSVQELGKKSGAFVTLHEDGPAPKELAVQK